MTDATFAQAASVAAQGQPEQRETGWREAVQMSRKFQSYVAFVDGIPIGIGTLTAISQFCNVRRRDMKKLVPQKWRHGGRAHRKPKAYVKKCGHVIEIIETRRFLGFSTEEMGRGKDGRISRKTS